MSDFTVSTRFTGDDKLSGVMATMGSGADRFASKLSKISGGMSKVSSAFSSVALPAAVLAGGIGLVSGNIIGAGASFEAAISAVGAVGLQTKSQIADLEAEALRLGATTKFTATESANAMEVMARAGFKNSEILSGVGPILSAAAASGLEIAEVANHVSNALKGMGLQATDAGRVADVLALASSKTNSSIGSLGESLSNVSSTARQFNIPLEETVAAVALLQDVGLDASVAGSALNTMLTQMAAPTDSITAKMKKWGVTFQDTKGNMLPFAKVLENISLASEKSGGNMDKVAFIAELVGLRGQKAASNLSDLFNSGKTSELTKILYDAKGAAEAMSELRMQNLSGDITLLDSAVDGLKVRIFDMNKGPMRGIVQATTEWVGKNEELIASGIGEFMGDMIRALPSILTGIKNIAIGIAIFKGIDLAIKGAAVAVEVYKGLVWATEVATKGWAVATALFTGKLKLAEAGMAAFNAVAALNPLVWIGAAIAGVILLAVYWDEATNAVARYIDTAFSLFSDEEKEKVDKKRKAISEGKLLEQEDTSGIDRAKDKGTFDGVAADIIARSKEIDAAIAKASQDPGKKPEETTAPGAAPATDGAPGGASAPAAIPVFSASEQAMRDVMGFGGNTGGRMFADVPTREERAASRDSKSEIVIRDETGRAQIKTAPDPKSGTSIKMKPSGAP